MESPLVRSDTYTSSISRINPKVLPLIFLGLLVTLVVVHRIATSNRPFSKDAAALSLVGQELVAGRSLYSDLLEIRPPLVMLAFGFAAAFTSGLKAIVLTYILAAVITAIGIYYAASYSYGQGMIGLWAVAFWAVLSNSGDIQAGDPNTELVMNMCQAWAFGCFIRITEDSKWTKVILVGILFLVASFAKQLAVIPATFLVFTYVALSEGVNRNFSKRLKQAGVIAGIGVVGWSLIFLYFGATGRLEIFKAALISNSIDYAAAREYLPIDRPHAAKVLLSNALTPIYGESEVVPNSIQWLAFLTVVGVVIGIVRRHRSAVYIVAFMAATWLEISLGGQFYPHYYQLWLPVFCIGGAWAVSEGLRLRLNRKFTWLPHASGTVVLVTLLVNVWPWYRMDLKQHWTGMETDDMVVARSLAVEINSLLRPEESFYNWGSNSELYIFTKRHPPTGVFWAKFQLGGTLRDTLSSRVVSDLKRTSPELIVTEKFWHKGYEDSQVLKWIAGNYELFPKNADRGPFTLYVRRGGALQARLMAQPQ